MARGGTRMEFSTMVLSMYVPGDDDAPEDARVIDAAIDQSLTAGRLGFNPWYTEHHFRGSWHSNPMQFAAFIVPQLPRERYVGFGVLSTPYYHPVRLVESMNLLDQLTKGRVLYGIGSGFPGKEPAGLGVDAEYHGTGRAAIDTMEILERLWSYKTGDPEYAFEMPTNRGRITRRVTPAPYRKRRPIIIRTATHDQAVVTAARNGWPAFLGTFGTTLDQQLPLYRKTLAEANHAAEVVDECRTWCTCDWLAVVVANTDAEAHARAEEAKAEQLAIRKRYIDRYGTLDGPVIRKKPGESVGAAFAAGGDHLAMIAGHPDTVAAQVQTLADQDVRHLLVRFLGEWPGKTRSINAESMRLFSERVMPRFKAAAATA